MPHAAKNPPAPVPFRDLDPTSPWLIEGDESTGLCALIFDSTNGAKSKHPERFTLLRAPRAECLRVAAHLRRLHSLGDCGELRVSMQSEIDAIRYDCQAAEAARNKLADTAKQMQEALSGLCDLIDSISASLPDARPRSIPAATWLALGDLESRPLILRRRFSL